MQKTLLISGFPPFGGHTVNPSSMILEGLGQSLSTVTIKSITVDCNWQQAFPQFKKAIQEHEPDLIVSLGLAANAKSVRIESRFYNENNTSIPDNAGLPAQSACIETSGPAVYDCHFSCELLSKLTNSYITGSNDAGRYLCNHLAYRTKHHIEQKNLQSESMFIHLPPLHIFSENQAIAVDQLCEIVDEIIAEALNQLS